MANIGSYPLNEIITGDSRLLAQSIPDESIDLIFTDPVYENIEDYAWLAEVAARILKPSGNLVAFCANKTSLQVANIFAEKLDFCDWLIYREMARRRKRWDKSIIGLYEIACWFSKGDSRLGDFVKNFAYVANGYVKKDTVHDWAKEPKGISNWIDKLSTQTVYDPFCGGGSTAVVCRMFEKDFIGSEINPENAEIARRHLSQTMYPLALAKPNKASTRQGRAVEKFEGFE